MPRQQGSEYNAKTNPLGSVPSAHDVLPERIRKKVLKMKIKILLFWAIFLSILLLSIGCITKPAKKLVGVVPTGNGTYRLQSAVEREKREALEKAKEEARKKTLEKARAEQLKLEAAKSKPKHIPQPVKPTPAIPKVSGVGKPEPFTPTVRETKLSPSQALIKMGEEAESNRIPPIVLQETGNVVIDKPNDSASQIAGPSEFEPKPIKVYWGKLLIYYLLAALTLGGILIWYRSSKKEEPKKTRKPRARKLKAKK